MSRAYSTGAAHPRHDHDTRNHNYFPARSTIVKTRLYWILHSIHHLVDQLRDIGDVHHTVTVDVGIGIILDVLTGTQEEVDEHSDVADRELAVAVHIAGTGTGQGFDVGELAPHLMCPIGIQRGTFHMQGRLAVPVAKSACHASRRYLSATSHTGEVAATTEARGSDLSESGTEGDAFQPVAVAESTHLLSEVEGL